MSYKAKKEQIQYYNVFKIQKNIKKCYLCSPFLTETTQNVRKDETIFHLFISSFENH